MGTDKFLKVNDLRNPGEGWRMDDGRWVGTDAKAVLNRLGVTRAM
jgi:hypothetical protein